MRLNPGRFSLHEDLAPAGYAVSLDIPFTVREDLTYTMADGAGTQTLLVKKIGDTMCSVAFFYDSPEAYETLLGCFSTITAA